MLIQSVHKHPRRTGEDGYTLLEVLVVLGITVLLAAVVGPRVMNYFSKAKHDTAQIQLTALANAVELYFLDVGKYPAQDKGLVALVEAPAGESSWHGPYLQKKDGLIDPWGQPYRYGAPGKHGPYDLYSFGEDNAEGGDAENRDIQNW